MGPVYHFGIFKVLNCLRSGAQFRITSLRRDAPARLRDGLRQQSTMGRGSVAGAPPFVLKGGSVHALARARERQGKCCRAEVPGATFKPKRLRDGLGGKVLGAMSNPFLVLSGRKKPCASRRFFGINKSITRFRRERGGGMLDGYTAARTFAARGAL